MFTLKLDEIPEEGLSLQWSEEKASLLAYLKDLSEIDFDFETRLQSEVKIQKAGQSVLITGRIQTNLRLQCVRCLKEFTYPLSNEFDLTLHPSKEAPSEEETELGREEMESSFFEGGEIHLSEIACEQVFLEIPYQPLCQEGVGALFGLRERSNLSPANVKEEFPTGFSAIKIKT
jgi:uncharacterized protein